MELIFRQIPHFRLQDLEKKSLVSWQFSSFSVNYRLIIWVILVDDPSGILEFSHVLVVNHLLITHFTLYLNQFSSRWYFLISPPPRHIH